MRLFIAIDFPKEIVNEVERIQSSLPFFEGKKIELENLHLTLKFLGEVSKEKIEEIKNKLKNIKLDSFNVKLNGIGIFSESFIRIIWIGVEGCEDLQKEIDISLQEFFKKEERFMGHLTIARVKNVGDRKEFILNLDRISVSKTSFIVKDFKLMSSELTKKGPIYSIIEKYPLEKKNIS